MYCTNCGTQIPPGATMCLTCRTPAPMAAAPVSGVQAGINNYLIPAILVTLCCCLPFGIVAIVYAAQVNSKLAMGDVAGAQESARNARMWTWIAFGSGIVVGIIWFAISFSTGFLNAIRHH